MNRREPHPKSLMPACSETAKHLVREYVPKIRHAAQGTHAKLNVTYLLMEFASKLESSNAANRPTQEDK